MTKAHLGRRGFVASLFAGVTVVAARWLWPSDNGRGFEILAPWSLPGGEGRMIAVSPGTTDAELRDLGRRLQDEFSDSESGVVMVFDGAEAGWLVRRGSRMVGEREFQEALTYQRAMYLKDTSRKEHTLTLYEVFPRPREVIRYGLEIQDRSRGEAREREKTSEAG